MSLAESSVGTVYTISSSTASNSSASIASQAAAAAPAHLIGRKKQLSRTQLQTQQQQQQQEPHHHHNSLQTRRAKCWLSSHKSQGEKQKQHCRWVEKNYLISRSFWPGQARPGERQQKVQKCRAKCKLNEIFMQRFLDVVREPKLATFGAKSHANASLDVLLNWKSHYHLDAFFECILSQTRQRGSETRNLKLESRLAVRVGVGVGVERIGIGNRQILAANYRNYCKFTNWYEID